MERKFEIKNRVLSKEVLILIYNFLDAFNMNIEEYGIKHTSSTQRERKGSVELQREITVLKLISFNKKKKKKFEKEVNDRDKTRAVETGSYQAF